MKRIPITAESLRTFFEVGEDNWRLKEWLVDDLTVVSDVTSIALFESDNSYYEFKYFEDGVLIHNSSPGDQIHLDLPFAFLEVSDSYYDNYKSKPTLKNLIEP